MATTHSAQKRYNPWGNDAPEKMNQSKSTVGLGAQVKGLFNPENFFDSMFGKGTSEQKPSEQKEPVKLRPNETVLFSHRKRDSEVNLQRETEQILAQLKKQVTLLEKSEKALSHDISKIKVEQLPPKAGIYYLRYFEWMLLVVRQLRMKVTEGRNWLSTFNNRKKKKMGYWKMYKKHGTTFGLSQERSLATQTG